MTRYRRWRWIAVTAAAATAATVLAVGAEAWADHGAASCARAPAVPASRPAATRTGADRDATGGAPAAWRAGAFQVAGCRAWRRLHRHDLLVRRHPNH